MQVVEHLERATGRIAAALGLGRRDARIDARVLAAHCWGVDAAWLIAHDTDPVDPSAATRFDALVEQRAAGHPVAHLVGQREFYGHPFKVSPAVLIPRPETELLVELALQQLDTQSAPAVLDLGTGSGCIAVSLALARPDAQVTALDRSAAALALAAENARALGARVAFVQGDWYAPLARRRFDLIVGNPPYIASGDTHLQQGDLRFEPLAALAAAEAGLADLQKLVVGARVHLRPGGRLLLEHGYDQADAMRALLNEAGFEARLWSDLAGMPRVSGGKVSEYFTDEPRAPGVRAA